MAVVALPLIEKCSSPIGDGNFYGYKRKALHEFIEKCSSPIGDGNIVSSDTLPFLSVIIEKCSSPIGDGNKSAVYITYAY